MEYLAGDDRVAYAEAGDMKLDLRRCHTGTFSFPSCHYHGLTVAFDLELAGQSLPLADLGAYPQVVHGAHGAYFRGDVPRAGEDTHPLFSDQDPGADAA